MFTNIIKTPNLKKTNKQLSKSKTSNEQVNGKDSLSNSCLNEKRKRTDYSLEEQISDESAECIKKYSKKRRKDSTSTEEIDVSSPTKKIKSLECKKPKNDPEFFQKLHSVSGNNETKSKNKEQERKSVRKKGNTTSKEMLQRTDLPGFMPNKKATGEPLVSGTKTAAKRQRLEIEHDVNDTSKRKTNKSENVDSDSIKPTLSETGFLWDVKPEDLSKPEEDFVEDNNEVSFIYFTVH